MSIAKSVDCHNCGAPLALKAGEVIITCEYCGTAFNVASDEAFFLKHSIIPANIDKEDCKEIVRRWMSSGSLKPSNLASDSRIADMSLTFLPFYIVHANVRTSFRGSFNRTGGYESRLGHLNKEYYWKILGRRGSRFPTKEYEIPLVGKETFSLSKIPDNAKYLNAEFDEKDADDLARSEIGAHQKFLLSDQVDKFDTIDHEFEIEDVEFIHAPVWKVDFTFRSVSYQVLLCGSTGEVIRGDIPPPDESVKGFFSDMKRAIFGR